jgi:phi LC3 family holin
MTGKKTSNRWRNPWLWVGVIGVILTACGVDASTFTTWTALGTGFIHFISNPFMIGTVVMALLGTYVDPTTGGLKD